MIHGGLKKKKYKTKFSTSLIKKIEKSYKKTKIIKKKKKEKRPMQRNTIAIHDVL